MVLCPGKCVLLYGYSLLLSTTAKHLRNLFYVGTDKASKFVFLNQN